MEWVSHATWRLAGGALAPDWPEQPTCLSEECSFSLHARAAQFMFTATHCMEASRACLQLQVCHG